MCIVGSDEMGEMPYLPRFCIGEGGPVGVSLLAARDPGIAVSRSVVVAVAL